MKIIEERADYLYITVENITSAEFIEYKNEYIRLGFDVDADDRDDWYDAWDSGGNYLTLMYYEDDGSLDIMVYKFQ